MESAVGKYYKLTKTQYNKVKDDHTIGFAHNGIRGGANPRESTQWLAFSAHEMDGTEVTEEQAYALMADWRQAVITSGLAVL